MRNTTRNYLKRLVVVDVESDGQLLGENSMVCFGAVLLTDPSVSFYGKVKPISDVYDGESLSISGFTREEHLTFDEPKEVMEAFKSWLSKNVEGRPILISDNNQYDGSWINYYFLKYVGSNPFGWSSRRIGDFWSCYAQDLRARWKWLRDTEHTHNPVDDAKGNAEAYMKMLIRSGTLKLRGGDKITAFGKEFEVFSVDEIQTPPVVNVYPVFLSEEDGEPVDNFLLTLIDSVKIV